MISTNHLRPSAGTSNLGYLAAIALAINISLAGPVSATMAGPVRLVLTTSPDKQMAVDNNQPVLGAILKGNLTDMIFTEVKKGGENALPLFHIALRSDPSALLNIQNGKLEFSVIPEDWWSTQWVLQEVNGAYKLVSRWKPGMAIGLDKNGILAAIPENADNTLWNALILEKDSRDGFDFSTARLLSSIEKGKASSAELSMKPVETLNENNALIARKMKEEIYRFISFDKDIVLCLNAQEGGLGLSQVAPDWWSGHWLAKPSPAGDGSIMLFNRWKPELLLGRDQAGKMITADASPANQALPDFHWKIALPTGEFEVPEPVVAEVDKKQLFTRQMLEVVDNNYQPGKDGTASPPVSSIEPGANSLPVEAQPSPSRPHPLEPAPQTIASRAIAPAPAISAPAITAPALSAPAITAPAISVPQAPATARPLPDAAEKESQTASQKPITAPDNANSAQNIMLSAKLVSTSADQSNGNAENLMVVADLSIANNDKSPVIAEPVAGQTPSVPIIAAKPAPQPSQMAANLPASPSPPRQTIEPVIVKPGSREDEAAKLPTAETIANTEKPAEKTPPTVKKAVTNPSIPAKNAAKIEPPKQQNNTAQLPKSKLAALMERIHGEVAVGNSNSYEVGPWQSYVKIYENDMLGLGETAWVIGDAFAWGQELKAFRGGIDLPVSEDRKWHLRYNFHLSRLDPYPVDHDYKWLTIKENEQQLELFRVYDMKGKEGGGHHNETGLFFNHLNSTQEKLELAADTSRDLSFSSRDIGAFTTGYFWQEDDKTKTAGNYYFSVSKGLDAFGATHFFKVREEAKPFPVVVKGRFNIRHDWKDTRWHVAASAGFGYADRPTEWHKHFSLGGMNYGSGFPSAEAAGEIGAGAWVEIGKRFDASLVINERKHEFTLTPYARADIGWVNSRYIDPEKPMDYMRDATLSSAMLGVRFETSHWTVDAGYGIALTGKSRFDDDSKGRFALSTSFRW